MECDCGGGIGDWIKRGDGNPEAIRRKLHKANGIGGKSLKRADFET